MPQEEDVERRPVFLFQCGWPAGNADHNQKSTGTSVLVYTNVCWHAPFRGSLGLMEGILHSSLGQDHIGH